MPDLRVVSARDVALHEDADPVRVERLVTRLRQDGVLRNPPVAAATPDDRYVVLDGANRTSALAAIGAPVVPLQVVDYSDPAIRLDVWRHLLVEPMDVVAAVRATGLSVERASREAAARALDERKVACYVVTDHDAFVVPLSGSHPLAATLSLAVRAYKGAARIYRVPTEDFEALAREYGEVAAIIVFPRLGKQDILEIAASSVKLPTGITRHLIPGRALRLNLPLDALTTPDSVEEKNRALRDLIRQRLLNNAVRYYPEGAYLFDE
ncbi:MAG TPA: ParB N-terminal domain-containing protein [bacterium]|nr:ParB N-terminal domain-containing protein [bacterium]